MHGWAIAQRVEQVSKEVLQVQQGSLYPALHRLEQQGWIKADWGESENKRRAKYGANRLLPRPFRSRLATIGPSRLLGDGRTYGT